MRRIICMEPREGLFEEIMGCIRKKELFYARCRMAALLLGFIGSTAVFLQILRMAEAEFASSGFTEFAMFLFYDFGAVLAYWQNFVLALAEALPAISVAALMVTVFISLQSVKIISKDLKLVYGYK